MKRGVVLLLPAAGDVVEKTLMRGVLEWVALAFEVTGVSILAIGGLLVAVRAVAGLRAHHPVYTEVRRGLGRVLLLGLEVLVAADVVLTVAVDQTLESVAILGLLVVVRTVLSFALAAEIDGVVPWKRIETKARLAALAANGAPGSAADDD